MPPTDPVFISTYRDPAPKNPGYCHLLYYTSAEVIRRLCARLVAFFDALAKLTPVDGLAIHGEFKLEGGQLFPIELNPMRFAGCGLADLAFHAFGINPYRVLDSGRPAAQH